jgi:hypothetical protein
MKKLLTLCFVLLGVAAQAQTYIWKVTPKFVETPTTADTISGISARFVSGAIKKGDIDYTFFVSFHRPDGSEVSIFSANLSRDILTERLIKRGVPPQTAQSQAQTLWAQHIPALIGGNITQQYPAALALSAVYGYTILPLSQQP